ncbi:MAG: prepilin-type N-terminal cleavage/methylation domain-containing protein [Candidatus Omnitrophota bacterium]
MNKKSFTLVEVIMVIVIVGVSFLGLAVTMQQVLSNIHKPRVMSVATLLAEKEAERIIGTGFAGAVNESLQSYSGNFSGYSYQVTITSVNADNKIVEVRVYHVAIGSVWLAFLKTNY